MWLDLGVSTAQVGQFAPALLNPADMNSKPVALDLSQYNPPSNAPRGHKKSSWTDQEDNLVRQHVATTGNKKWSKCAHMLIGRTGKQCRERWHNHLDPTINKEPWTDAEHEIFLQAHAKYGNQWALISQMLPGRTDNAVKNRYNNMRAKATGERSTGSKKRKLQELQSQASAAQAGQQHVMPLPVTTSLPVSAPGLAAFAGLQSSAEGDLTRPASGGAAAQTTSAQVGPSIVSGGKEIAAAYSDQAIEANQ